MLFRSRYGSRRRGLNRWRRTSSLLGANGKRKHEREQNERGATHRGGEGYRHGGPLVSVHCHRRTPRWRLYQFPGAIENYSARTAILRSTAPAHPAPRCVGRNGDQPPSYRCCRVSFHFVCVGLISVLAVHAGHRFTVRPDRFAKPRHRALTPVAAASASLAVQTRRQHLSLLR